MGRPTPVPSTSQSLRNFVCFFFLPNPSIPPGLTWICSLRLEFLFGPFVYACTISLQSRERQENLGQANFCLNSLGTSFWDHCGVRPTMPGLLFWITILFFLGFVAVVLAASNEVN